MLFSGCTLNVKENRVKDSLLLPKHTSLLYFFFFLPPPVCAPDAMSLLLPITENSPHPHTAVPM